MPGIRDKNAGPTRSIIPVFRGTPARQTARATYSAKMRSAE